MTPQVIGASISWASVYFHMAWTIWIFVKLRVLSQLLVNSCEVKHLVNAPSLLIFCISSHLFIVLAYNEKKKKFIRKKNAKTREANTVTRLPPLAAVPLPLSHFSLARIPSPPSYGSRHWPGFRTHHLDMRSYSRGQINSVKTFKAYISHNKAKHPMFSRFQKSSCMLNFTKYWLSYGRFDLLWKI